MGVHNIIGRMHLKLTPSFPAGKAAGVALFFLCYCMHPADAASAPSTIPALQQWTTGSGTCAFGPLSRIVVNNSDAAALTTDAQTFADDLSGLLGRLKRSGKHIISGTDKPGMPIR